MSWLLVVLRLMCSVLCALGGVSGCVRAGVWSRVWFDSVFYQCVLWTDPDRCEGAVVLQGLGGSRCKWESGWLGREVLAVCMVTKGDGRVGVGVGVVVRCRVFRRMREVQ